ncbi:MAG TPA: hypothetical protein VGB77_21490, partial [Abditibacteriaceae bacterium]
DQAHRSADPIEAKTKRPPNEAPSASINIKDFMLDDIMVRVRQVFVDDKERTLEEAVRDVCRDLGFERVGPNIKTTLEHALKVAVKRRILKCENRLYSRDTCAVGDYETGEHVQALRAAMGRGWWEREDAMRAAARHLGFSKLGPNIRQAFRSAFNSGIRQKLLEANGSAVRRL